MSILGGDWGPQSLRLSVLPEVTQLVMDGVGAVGLNFG